MVHFYKHNNGLWLNATVKPKIIHILCQVPKLSTSVTSPPLYQNTNLFLLFKIRSMNLSQVSFMIETDRHSWMHSSGQVQTQNAPHVF